MTFDPAMSRIPRNAWNAAAEVIHRVQPLARVGPVRRLAGFSVFDHGGGSTQTSIPLRSGVGFRPA